MGWVIKVMPRLLYPRERTDPFCTDDLMVSSAGLDGCGKPRRHQESIPELSSPSQVAVLAVLYRPGLEILMCS